MVFQMVLRLRGAAESEPDEDFRIPVQLSNRLPAQGIRFPSPENAGGEPNSFLVNAKSL
jgi:hypothetical protein